MVAIFSTVLVTEMQGPAGRRETPVITPIVPASAPQIEEKTEGVVTKFGEGLQKAARYLYTPKKEKEKARQKLNKTREAILKIKNEANNYLLWLSLNDMGFKGTYDAIKFPLPQSSAKNVSVASLNSGIAKHKREIEKLTKEEYQYKKALGLYTWSDLLSLKKFSQYLPGYRGLSQRIAN